MSLQKSKKIRSGMLGALLAFTSLTGFAGAASAQPATVPEGSETAVDSSWLENFYTDALGTGLQIGGASSGRWIEYNLSSFCLTLHDGGSVPFKTCQTSSGKKGHGTPAGSFKVYKKAAGPICMHPPGDDEVCGIHYATYWGKGGYAFHEAWWMGNRVQQRISHGCVNMRKGDAQTVFNFATIGMPVKVHW